MLLAIDIGNSNISIGLFGKENDLKFLASIDTDSRKTADQMVGHLHLSYGVWCMERK